MDCISCGKSAVIGNLCSECYLHENEHFEVPRYVDLTLCYFCSSRRSKRSWIEEPSQDESLIEGVIDSIKPRADVESPSINVELEYLDERNINAYVGIDFYIQGVLLHQDLETKVRLKVSVCTNCSKISGSYFESILQIRAEGRPLFDDEFEELKEVVEEYIQNERKHDKTIFITKSETLKTGLDFYLSSNAVGADIMKRLAKRYSATTKLTSKLVGQKNGKDLYRNTCLVRLPQWRPRDVIKVNDRFYSVVLVESHRVATIDLQNRNSVSHRNQELKHVSVYRYEDILYSAVIVSFFRDEITVLDPVNMQTRVLLLPKRYTRPDEGQEEIEVYRIEEELFLA